MAIRSHKKTTKTMTEQELRQEFKNHSDCYSDAFEVIQAMTEDAAIALAKAYADARVAEKDAEIRNLKSYISAIESDNANNSMNLDNLDAEIKRLRDGIKKGFEKLAEIPYCSVLRTIFDNAKGVQNDLESLLSPAPVTETTTEFRLRNLPQDTTNILPKNEDQE